MKVLTVVGARPQFIKASVVSAQLRNLGGVEEFLIHTGQHYDDSMSTVFFEGLDLGVPDVNLGIGSGGHGHMTGRMMVSLEQHFLECHPDCVLVYGDTNSTLAAALVAVKLNLPIAHVEAGLRSGNMKMPEEVNRIVTDAVANILFAPSSIAQRRLENEAKPFQRIVNAGDVMFDLALRASSAVRPDAGILAELSLVGKHYCLTTIHRAENTDCRDRLCVIAEALAQVARELTVVLPLHPRTRKAMAKFGLLDSLVEHCLIIEPIDYIAMVALEKYAQVILTDSGGVQKEAYFHKVPCVTVRTETEWPELCDLGWNRLITPLVAGEIASTVLAAVGCQGVEAYPYGDGNAGHKIAMELTK